MLIIIVMCMVACDGPEFPVSEIQFWPSAETSSECMPLAL